MHPSLAFFNTKSGRRCFVISVICFLYYCTIFLDLVIFDINISSPHVNSSHAYSKMLYLLLIFIAQRIPNKNCILLPPETDFEEKITH